MALETLNKDSKVTVYNSGVDLTDKTAAPKSQGVAAEALNFVKIVATAPTTGKAGEVFYNTGDSKLYIATADNTFARSPNAFA